MKIRQLRGDENARRNGRSKLNKEAQWIERQNGGKKTWIKIKQSQERDTHAERNG